MGWNNSMGENNDAICMTVPKFKEDREEMETSSKNRNE